MIKFECQNCGRQYEKLPIGCPLCGRTIFKSIDQKRYGNN
jgi:predicted  nucleic acid-binding Zn-ribbon protein